MLITKLKDNKKLSRLIEENTVFIFKCFGCREVFFPEEEADIFINENKDKIRGMARIDYLCNEEFTDNYIHCFADKIKEADRILVFSCGVGVQVVSKLLDDIIVLPGCNTYYLKGFQGVTVQDVDCEQCGYCYLNITGGLCPITSCSKGLLNGACGGADDKGKCEVNHELDCGWILIYKRLNNIKGKELLINSAVNIRDYSLITGKEQKNSS